MKFSISLILELLMIIVMLSYYSKISKKDIKIDYKTILSIVLFDIIIVLNNSYSPINLRLILSIISSILLNKIIFNTSIKETIMYTIIFFLFSFVFELVIAIFFTTFRIDMSNLNNNFILKNLFAISEAIVVYLAFLNNYINNLINKIIINIKNEINFTPIVSFTIIFLNIITIFLANNSNNKYILFLSISSIIFIIFCARTIINDKYYIGELKQLNTTLKNSHKAYSSTIDECKELKHNLKNDLLAIKSLVAKKHQNAINEILLKYNKQYEWISKIDEIPEGLQGIIYLKSTEARNKKIEVVINTNNTIPNIKRDYFSLCSIVGIMLDNAIESCEKSKKKIISITIKYTDNLLKIEIINPIVDKLDLEKIGNKNYSTKKVKSGLGLNFIKKIKNKSLMVNYKIVNNLFISSIYYKI